MIRFANPKKEKLASGGEALVLTESGTWESFPGFAENYARQIGAKVLSKSETADMHLWELQYDGYIQTLLYDDFPNGVSLEPKGPAAQAAIEALYEIALLQRDPDGL